MLKCHLCGKEYFYDSEICHECEEIAVTGLRSQDRRNSNKWRCDNFLEVSNLAFGSNLNAKRHIGLNLIQCPTCGVEYSYGRSICHTCEENSIPFGKIFEAKPKLRRWNCDTAMACIELLDSDLDTIELIVEEEPHLEKLENSKHEWNTISAIKFNNIQMDEKKINRFLRFE
ncbi:MAG: hypothetical protein ACXAEX_03360 [Promethearchaeota archaeon]|jgi:hypothetical protein